MITAIQNPNRINLTPVSRNIFGGDVVYGELSGSFRKMLRNARIQKQLRRPASIPASQLPKNITANKRKIFGITPSNIEIFAVPKNPEIPNKRPNYENLLSGDEILLLNGDDAIIELNETGQLGSWLSKTVRKVKKEISRTTKRVGKEIKRSSKKVSKQIKRSGKDINKGVKKLGKNVEVLVKKNKKTLLHIAGAVALVLTYGAISSALAAKGAAAAAASSSAGAAGAAGAGAAAGTAGTMAIPVTLTNATTPALAAVNASGAGAITASEAAIMTGTTAAEVGTASSSILSTVWSGVKSGAKYAYNKVLVPVGEKALVPALTSVGTQLVMNALNKPPKQEEQVITDAGTYIPSSVNPYSSSGGIPLTSSGSGSGLVPINAFDTENTAEQTESERSESDKKKIIIAGAILSTAILILILKKKR